MTLSTSNTIDFDSARLRLNHDEKARSSLIVPPSKPIRHMTLMGLQQRLTQQLQTSLEIDRVLDMFFNALQEFIGLNSLEFRHDAHSVQIQKGTSSMHRCSYRMTHAGDFLGEIQFTRAKRFSEHQLQSLETLLGNLLYPLRNALMYREALRFALNDSLTGIGNRMSLDQALSREVKCAARHHTPLSLLIMDIDHFKQINDKYGHAYGDAALKAIVSCTRNCLRDVDELFRMGGEEFVVLLANTDNHAARFIAERIRRSIEQMQFEIDGDAIPMTASLGIATLKAGEKEESLLERGDKLMYTAKRAGRNRIAC
ncbi:GGDEF domain-containing protein [Halopseudomonas pelagia]|uniref:GGDEF domain-containing protein n=1 Tax=Halopseudomonas pelagia TaxID=553151 RepID=UPI00039D782D|nr:GGDEF domain-containing protein [Halopseudomonas pelagia]|tara:strand:+ start:14534 stop:15472 length:939 start_codon:yes stop_codon:yes gene_type:complete